MTGPIVDFSRSQEIQRKLQRLVPGGCHTYSKGVDQFPMQSPQIMARADGVYCWDVDGNRFIDWAMGNRVIALGHNYPVVNEAVKRQMDLGLNFTRPGVLEFEFAEYVLELLPWFDMVKFGKNGSDVTTAAVKLARAATGRDLVARCSDHPFFAIHDWFIATTAMDAGIPDETRRHTLGFPYNDIEALEEMFKRNPGRVSAVILEPVKNDPPRDGYLEKMRDLTQREGAVLIFDEMIATMKFDLRGAHHRYGVHPDLATYGKAISNGFCFSMLVGKREIMELGGLNHEKRRVFLLSQTHSSETTGLAACRATLEEARRVDLISHVWAIGERLVKGVRDLARTEGVADFVRVIGFDCNPQILCTRADGTYWPELHTSFHEEIISHGVLIPWTTITYGHGETELSQTFAALQEGMRKVRRIIENGTPVDETFSGAAVKPVFRTYNRCMQSRCGRLHKGAPLLACCGEGQHP